ncbi:MAG: glycosyltransferase family 2 protein [Lachnospiraceae bacterium]|nr:glycosyltransferase family 2 protein [Lachnospiraceae bacterium]
MKYYIDSIQTRNSEMVLSGWAVSDSPDVPVEIEIVGKKNGKIPFTRTDAGRFDVNREFFLGKSELKLGFCITFSYDSQDTYEIIFRVGGKTLKGKLAVGGGVKGKHYVLFPRLRLLFRRDTISRGMAILRQYGWKAFFKKLAGKLKKRRDNYHDWRVQVQPSLAELAGQREARFAFMPKFSILVPLYRTPGNFLSEMVKSVQEQTYGNWELCLADGSGMGQVAEDFDGDEFFRQIQNYQKSDKRIRCVRLPENLGIAGNTNAALSMAEGDYIVLLDHDDILTEDALYECAFRINREAEKNRKVQILYSDEDKLTLKKGRAFYFDAHFKPDFNPDLLRSMNYISHLFVVEKALVKQIGGFRTEFDGSQDYDFVFRCIEQADVICHIPKVLYHWRVNEGSTAEDPKKKLYAFEAGARAIKAHCERIGLGAVEVEENEVLGAYRVRYPLKEEPLVSVIIPSKDHTKDLCVCVKSLMEKATYKNIEVIVVENNSTEEETFQCYEELEAAYENLRVIKWPQKGFNFSAINNYALSYAKGEYLLFLNNDTELIDQDCIEELLGFCQRDEVGIVGAQLFYDDDTIQHAGVVVGYKGIAGHVFTGFHRGEKTYFLRSMCAQDYSAVTAACMMTKRNIFEEAGGFDEGLAVAFNDIDYCLKVRKLGKLVVYNPFARLYHYESKSRGIEDTPEKILRFDQEVETFRDRWKEVLEEGDPYYNPNLTLLSPDFSLRNFEKEPLKS